MNKKVLSLALALGILLSGCSSTQSYTPPDYSAHTSASEANCRTELIDAEKLKEGGPVLALRQGADEEWLRPFDGLEKDDTWGYDLRSRNVSGVDLSEITDYNDISFNSRTVWPAQLPSGFDPEALLEFNKNPGLGIRALHAQGITGSGVGVAIIDQALFTDHEQYRDNLMSYELIHCSDGSAQMHGSAVASIAVGKDVGVAPGAKLYYIGSTFGHYTDEGYEFDASVIADGILRVLELNRHLPKGGQIRVISISKGYDKNAQGYEALTAAIKEADRAGVFVLTTSTSEFYDFTLWGMDRDYLADPDDPQSYVPGSWYADTFYANPEFYRDYYFVPMGSRTYAGFTGEQDYALEHNGGLSWAVPWCAGFYALCCQVKPELTPSEFIAAVKATAVTTELEHNGSTYSFGNIVDPAAAIALLQGG